MSAAVPDTPSKIPVGHRTVALALALAALSLLMIAFNIAISAAVGKLGQQFLPTLVTAISLAVATICIVGSARWQEKDPRDPKKRFANLVWQRGLDWGQQTATRLHLVRVSRFVAERRQRTEE